MPDFDKFLGFPISPFEESQSIRGIAPAHAMRRMLHISTRIPIT